MRTRLAPVLLLATVACAPKAGEKPAEAVSGPGGDLVYVTNEDSRDLTIIDASTDSVIATIFVGTRPRGVKVSPDGKTVYVALSGSPKCPPTMPDEECEKLPVDKSQDGIAVVDVASMKTIKTIPGGSEISGSRR